MNKTEIVAKTYKILGNTKLGLKRHSPEIMIIGGIVGTIAASVMACRATTKVDNIIGDTREKLHTIREGEKNGYIEDCEYTKEDAKKDTVIVYTQTALKMVKLYAPSIILGSLSIGSILTGHNITRKRNMALATAYSALDRSFKKYRKRVAERYGEEIEQDIRYGVKSEEIIEKTVNSKGKEKEVKKTIRTIDENSILNGPFSRCYDDGCIGWSKDAEANKMFLEKQQRWANDKLEKQGHLFLNDVFEMLGFPKTSIGGEYGWIYEPDDPDFDGVNFGILFDAMFNVNNNFINCRERTIWLNFNVMGPILSKLDNYKYNY